MGTGLSPNSIQSCPIFDENFQFVTLPPPPDDLAKTFFWWLDCPPILLSVSCPFNLCIVRNLIFDNKQLEKISASWFFLPNYYNI
ncbi:hypothetical protein TNIN_1921 [Trichonephila inaurata madagascariensis]|uniref:Uncharacterized protein n=1 Tax=Trichonephila inaurata madagascariensis TaxID=2747483 RepID=A0A8X7CAS7_9ARAC|nr:hypothetical protein TNIN_1921 [Trichonephila inaurata madagascariensis]